MIIVGLLMLGLFMVSSMGNYLNVYYVHGGDRKAASIVGGVVGTTFLVMGFASVPLVTWIAEKIDKRNTLILTLFLALVGSLLKWFCYTPESPYLQLVPFILMGPGIMGLWMLVNSMLADVCDYEEFRNGLRREGAIGAVYGWFVKSGLALSFFIAGLILVETGFDAKLGWRSI